MIMCQIIRMRYNWFFGYKAKKKKKKTTKRLLSIVESSNSIHPNEIQELIRGGGMVQQLNI